MALVLENSCFIHIPKTAGSFVRTILQVYMKLRSVEPSNGELPRNRIHHMRLKDVKLLTDRPIFSFVRHPVDWYVSAYTHRLSTGQWPVLDETDETMIFFPEFQQWVDLFTVERPGYLGKLYSEYVGEKSNPIAYIGHTEIVRHSLLQALALFDEDLSRAASIYSTLPVNEAQRDRPVPEPETVGAIMESERETVKRFGYDR